jgi:hypothetical protein
MIEVKKNFFRRPTSAEIIKNTNNIEITDNFWENIAELKNNESLTLVGRLFPEKFPTSDDFLKNGQVVNVPTKDKHHPLMKPYELREQTFDSLPKNLFSYAGFVFIPHFGVDKTPRRVRLNDILEAARIYSYAPYSETPKLFIPSIQLKIYDAVNGVFEIGASVNAQVPSRTKGRRKYKMSIDHIPIVDNSKKFNIAYMTKTDHVCEDKTYDLKFPSSNRPGYISEYRMDEHEIAVQYAIIAHYLNLEVDGKKKPNLIPLDMNLFGIPTIKFSRSYDNMLHRVLLKENPESNPITLNEGHMEPLLWEGLIKEGYRKCFFKSKEGKVEEFEWTKYVPAEKQATL